jgi:hypothetical protein
MLGYSTAEIQQLCQRRYSKLLHPEDRDKFLRFIDALACKEQTLTLQYRMRRKDGSLLYVVDTTSSHLLEDGKMYGFSVLSELPEDRWKIAPDSPFPAVVPYGFMQCTCEKFPKITAINAQMLEYLGATEENTSWQALIKENLYFVIPVEERAHFQAYLDEASEKLTPINIEHQLFCMDGSRITLMGWLSVVENRLGEKEFAFIYMRTEYKHIPVQNIQDTSYLRALENAYDFIFELNAGTSIVECIYCKDWVNLTPLVGVQMTLESAKTFWLENYIMPDDRSMVRKYIVKITTLPFDWGGHSVLQCEFRTHRVDGPDRLYLGVAVQLDASRSLLCGRNITDLDHGGVQTEEERAMNRLHGWLDYFSAYDATSLGMLALEEQQGDFYPVYISPQISERLHPDDHELTLQHYLAAVGLTQEDFNRLVADKQLTLRSEQFASTQMIRLTCNTYRHESSTLYIMRVYAAAQPSQNQAPTKRVFARTFGHFDLFVDGVPITFKSSKEKELMALLIDRNGGTLSTSEAISYLWEDEAADERVSTRYRKLAMGLKQTLTKYGIEDIMLNHNGVRSVDVSAIQCDYYDLLAGESHARQAFHNVYMSDYSWSEETLATLWDYAAASAADGAQEQA